MSRGFLATLLSATATLAFAAPAAAHGIIDRDGDVLSFIAPDPRWGAQLTITSPFPGAVVFYDRTSPGGVSWGPCLPLSERRTRCSVRGITRIEVEVYDGNDRVTVQVTTPTIVDAGPGADEVIGGYGNDQLDGGSGPDVLVGGDRADVFTGGDGDDLIRARDGVPDRVGCGLGSDRVELDDRDDSSLLALLDCEAVDAAPAAADGDAPRIRLAVGRPLRLGEAPALRVGASLDEPGELTVGGSILLGGQNAGALVPDQALPNAPGQRWALRPRIPDRLDRRLRRHLRAGRLAFAVLATSAEDRAGNRASRRTRVRLAL